MQKPQKPSRAAAPKTVKPFGPGYGKYGNRRVGAHASVKEHTRAAQLRMWERKGLIADLREQVPYELIPAQYGDGGTDLKGKPVRALIERGVRYVADFVYTMDGTTVVEDTKGFRTPEYIIKRKLMLWIHGIRIHEV